MIFNLDSSVSNDDLFQLFGVHGEIKEVRICLFPLMFFFQLVSILCFSTPKFI